MGRSGYSNMQVSISVRLDSQENRGKEGLGFLFQAGEEDGRLGGSRRFVRNCVDCVELFGRVRFEDGLVSTQFESIFVQFLQVYLGNQESTLAVRTYDLCWFFLHLSIAMLLQPSNLSKSHTHLRRLLEPILPRTVNNFHLNGRALPITINRHLIEAKLGSRKRLQFRTFDQYLRLVDLKQHRVMYLLRTILGYHLGFAISLGVVGQRRQHFELHQFLQTMMALGVEYHAVVDYPRPSCCSLDRQGRQAVDVDGLLHIQTVIMNRLKGKTYLTSQNVNNK